MVDDAAIATLFNPLYARFENTSRFAGNPPLLAHYTSMPVMEKIFEKNEVWFSNPLFMNDLQELRFGLNQGALLFSDPQLLRRAGGTDARSQLLQHASRIIFKSSTMTRRSIPIFSA